MTNPPSTDSMPIGDLPQHILPEGNTLRYD